VALEDFAAVVAAFRVPGPLTDVEPVGGGHIHGSWRIVAAGRTWFLQRLNSRVFPDPQRVARLGADLARHLADRLDHPPADLREELDQVVVPRPVPTRQGDLVHTAADGGAWRLSTWVDGTTSRAVARDADDCHVAGRAFGALHRLLDDLDPSALTPVWPRFHATAPRLQALTAAATRDAAGRAGSCAPELAAVASHAPLAAAFASLDLPVRVVHNDAKLANILLADAGHRWRAVVDWDTAGPGSRLHDFGDLVRSLVSGAAEDEPDPAAVVVEPQRWDALVEGYLATASALLTPTERAHLRLAGQVITLEQAARFLTDHLDGDLYYRVQDPQHNLRRTRAQLALLAQL
jgi:N-acetylhexosamine 1-kinase